MNGVLGLPNGHWNTPVMPSIGMSKEATRVPGYSTRKLRLALCKCTAFSNLRARARPGNLTSAAVAGSLQPPPPGGGAPNAKGEKRGCIGKRRRTRWGEVWEKKSCKSMFSLRGAPVKVSKAALYGAGGDGTVRQRALKHTKQAHAHTRKSRAPPRPCIKHTSLHLRASLRVERGAG